MSSNNKKPLNPLSRLRKYLYDQDRLGHLKNIGSDYMQELSSQIEVGVSRYYEALLAKNIRFFTSSLKKAFYGYREHLSDRHKIRSYTLSNLNPKFKEQFDTQRALALEMIKTQNEENLMKMKNRFLTWVTLKNSDNDKAKLKELTKVPSNKHIKFILKDQTSKMINSFDRIVSDEYGGALAFQWKINNDNRVVGKPGGLYPNAEDNETHGNHYKRKDKWYYNPKKKKELEKAGVKMGKFAGSYDSNKDGMPGEPIGCRCWAYYVYDIEDLPKNLL